MAPLSFQRCLSRWKCQEMAPGHVSVQKMSWKVIWMLEFKMAPFFSYYCLFFSKKTAKIMHRFMKNGAIYEVRCYWVLYQLFYIFFKIKSTQKYNFDAHYMVSEKKGGIFTFLMTFWGFVAIFYWNSSSHCWKNGAIFLSGAFRDFIDKIFKKYTIKPFQRTSNHIHTTNRKKRQHFYEKLLFFSKKAQ